MASVLDKPKSYSENWHSLNRNRWLKSNRITLLKVKESKSLIVGSVQINELKFRCAFHS